MLLEDKLIKKIDERDIVVGVVGLGYVGLPLAVEKAKAGYKTVGFDIQDKKVNMINDGINYIGDVVDAELESLVKQGILSATSDFSFIKDVDFIAICVPTPLDEHQQPDISYVKESAIQISKYLKRETMVVLESTTYPGTTEELIMPILEKHSGLKCGKDFYLAFSPERVDPGNLLYRTKNTPKVVGAIGESANRVISHMYKQVLEGEIVKVSSPKVAEMEKILENAYRNINISLANEMAMICERMGINVWEVIDAAKSKPYGFQAFYPGPGVGGHCIPIDPYYLIWKAKEYNYHARLIETSGQINDNMPRYIVERCFKILNGFKKSMNGSRILVVGIAYKQDIDDYRESPAIQVMSNLKKEFCSVDFYDPLIPEYNFENSVCVGIEELTPNVLKAYDLVLITAAHTGVNYEMIQKNAEIIFDTKNVMKDIVSRDNIILL